MDQESQDVYRLRLMQDCICIPTCCVGECASCAQIDPEEPCLREEG